MNGRNSPPVRGAVILFLVSAVLAAAAVTVVWSAQPSVTSSTSDEQRDDGTAVLTRWDPSDRPVVEPFTGRVLDGSGFDSASLEGRVAVVNVWGSWCAPCREEAPMLAEVSRDLRGEVEFLGVNVRDNDDAARAFERTFAISYPSIRTSDSPAVVLAFDGALTSVAVPSTVVLDAEGRVAARVVGVVDETTLCGLVDDARAPEAP